MTVYQYRTIEFRPNPLAPNQVKIVDLFWDEDRKTIEKELDQDVSVFMRLNELAAEGWRLANVQPGCWYLERSMEVDSRELGAMTSGRGIGEAILS